jgi:hypothetical protein
VARGALHKPQVLIQSDVLHRFLFSETSFGGFSHRAPVWILSGVVAFSDAMHCLHGTWPSMVFVAVLVRSKANTWVAKTPVEAPSEGATFQLWRKGTRLTLAARDCLRLFVGIQPRGTMWAHSLQFHVSTTLPSRKGPDFAL